MIFRTECNGCDADVTAKFTGKLIGASKSGTGAPIFPAVEILERDCDFEGANGCRVSIDDAATYALDNYLEDVGIYG